LIHLLSVARPRDREVVGDCLRRDRAERSADMVHRVRALMDDYASIEFASEFAEGILVTAEAYFEQAFARAKPGPDLDFLRALAPYVWARWR
jgi:geranylgeranyl diphosphate synthase type II